MPAAASFDEIRRLLPELPGPDAEARMAAERRQKDLLKPPGALGRLEEIAHWLAAWQGRERPQLERPRVAVFAGNHGVAAKGVSAFPQAVTKQMVRAFQEGWGAVNQLAKLYDCDLRVYEMALDHPTADMSEGPAMSEADCAGAIAYGMLSVEPGYDVMALGEMGIANTTAAAALSAGLFGGKAADWVGPGTGVPATQMQGKIAVVEQALEKNRAALGDPLTTLAALGGLELAAIAGAVLACRLAKVPVLLDGYATTAAAAVLYRIDPRFLDHCLVAHCSAEPGHRRLLEKIGKRPLLDLDMRLGEASGATLAISLLKASLACFNGMATFAQAGVAGKSA